MDGMCMLPFRRAEQMKIADLLDARVHGQPESELNVQGDRLHRDWRLAVAIALLAAACATTVDAERYRGSSDTQRAQDFLGERRRD